MTQVNRSTQRNSGRLSLIVAAILILANTITTTRAQQPEDNTNAFGCTVCADGSVPNFDATIGETSCRTIANAISQTPANSELCVMTQLQGYIYCNCPTYPTDTYCSLCGSSITNTTNDDGTEYYYNPIPAQNRDNIIPGTNLTCDEAEFIKKGTTNITNSSSSSSCTTTLPDSAAEYCGCTSMTKKTCFLCNNDTNTSMLYTNRLLPPLFTTSCGSLDRSIGLLLPDVNNDKCSGTNTPIDALFQTIPVTVQEYCGCSSSLVLNVSQSPDTCNICNGTQSVRNPNAKVTIINDVSDGNSDVVVSCADLEIVTRYVTNDTYCTTISTQYESVCCSDETIELAPTTRSNIPRAPPSSPAQSPSMNNNDNNNITVPTNASSNTTSSSSTSGQYDIYSFQSMIQTILLTSFILLILL